MYARERSSPHSYPRLFPFQVCGFRGSNNNFNQWNNQMLGQPMTPLMPQPLLPGQPPMQTMPTNGSDAPFAVGPLGVAGGNQGSQLSLLSALTPLSALNLNPSSMGGGSGRRLLQEEDDQVQRRQFNPSWNPYSNSGSNTGSNANSNWNPYYDPTTPTAPSYPTTPNPQWNPNYDSSATSAPPAATNPNPNWNPYAANNPAFNQSPMGPAPQPQCAGMCGSPTQQRTASGAGCMCNSNCYNLGNCCPGYAQVCEQGAQGPLLDTGFNTPPGACVDDSDCPYNYYCDWSSSICRVKPTVGQQCDVNTQCQSGLDCIYRDQSNSQTCEVACEYGEWTEWSECDQPCFEGSQFRTRDVVAGTNCGDAALSGRLDQSSRNQQFNENMQNRGRYGSRYDNNYNSRYDQGGRGQTYGRGYNQNTGTFESRPCQSFNYQPPQIDRPSDITIMQNTQGRQSILLTGIETTPGAGGMGREARITIEARSSDSSLISNEEVQYRSPSKSGTLSFNVRPDKYGQTTLRITVSDKCQTTETSVNIVVRADRQDCIQEWSEWSCCSQTCSENGNSGTQTRRMYILQEGRNGGRVCTRGNTEETRRCGFDPCPIDCKVQWSSWSACSASCGTGERTRTVSIVTAPSNNGVQCPNPPPVQSEQCSLQACYNNNFNNNNNNNIGNTNNNMNGNNQQCVGLNCFNCVASSACDFDLLYNNCVAKGSVNQNQVALNTNVCPNIGR